MAALAKKTKSSPTDVIQRFQKGADGDRLAAIQQVQGNPNPACFQIILDALRNPRSPFEQYRALLVAQDMLPQINAQQKQVLRDNLQYQRSGAEGAIIDSRDSSRLFSVVRFSLRWGVGRGAREAQRHQHHGSAR
jgi:hypothetical protein